MAKPQTFQEAKALADQAYINFWEDKSDAITKNWTQKDYDLITNPQYENVKVVTDSRRGTTKQKEGVSYLKVMTSTKSIKIESVQVL